MLGEKGSSAIYGMETGNLNNGNHIWFVGGGYLMSLEAIMNNYEFT